MSDSSCGQGYLDAVPAPTWRGDDQEADGLGSVVAELVHNTGGNVQAVAGARSNVRPSRYMRALPARITKTSTQRCSQLALRQSMIDLMRSYARGEHG
jgi:hypothetical protein